MTAPFPMPRATALSGLAVVAIGRNEGERLERCLSSVTPSCACIVYVDSGSTDGSSDMARAKGAITVPLDLRTPFTAARARNAGFEAALRESPHIRYVQFVDGDCEIQPGWLEAALDYLDAHPGVAIVFGRRNERHPDRSIYNRLCDIEWNAPEGEALYCGGDIMVRADALRQTGGYKADLIAGEEPELCVRLRQNGWKIMSLGLPMTLHDAAMTRFVQWWRRAVRCGYAFAEGAYLHGAPPERHWVRESRRAWIWGAILPLTIAAVAPWSLAVSAALMMVYPAQIARLYLQRIGKMDAPLLVSVFQVIQKIPEAAGQLKFHRNRIFERETRLIEYK